MIKRSVKPAIEADYRRKKVIVLLGARQVGKTTLLDELRAKKTRVLSLNCDNYDDAMVLEGKNAAELRQLLSGYDLVFVDEVQRVKNIGLTLKIIGDMKLDAPQVIVTGSSSLDMASEINEPATGRLGWALAAVLGFLGMHGMFASGCSRAELTSYVWPVELLCLIFGLWAMFFAPARLPNYYDENRVTAVSQGPVRLNLAGIRIHNGNWPHILTALRWWLVVTPAVYPTIYDYLRQIAAARWTWPWEVWLVLVAILGMFIPVIILAKRYE